MGLGLVLEPVLYDTHYPSLRHHHGHTTHAEYSRITAGGRTLWKEARSTECTIIYCSSFEVTKNIEQIY